MGICGSTQSEEAPKKDVKTEQEKKPAKQVEQKEEQKEEEKEDNSTVQGKYKFKRTLGKGASCRVVEAVEKRGQQRRLAIKIMSKEKSICKQLYTLEVAILSKIEHKNIIRFIGNQEDQHNYYVVTGLCSGGELFDRIVSPKTEITERDATKLVKNMLEAIQYLHSRNIVHRDLKPENYVFASTAADANLVLIDFGCAKEVEDEVAYKDMVGTVYYLAPELAAQSSKVPRTGAILKASDIWSIGVITYVMLTGRPPFNGKTNKEIFTNIIKKPLVFPSDIELSDGMKDFVKRALVKNPFKRISLQDALRHPWVNGKSATDISLNKDVMKYLKQFNYQSKLKKAITGALASNMSDEPEREVRNHFNRLDADHSGFLEVDELLLLLQDMGYAPVRAKHEAEKMLQAADLDGDGMISFDEFKRVWHRKLLTQHEQYVHRVFAVFDDNGDGFLDAAELQGVVGESFDDILAMISEVDDNNDGKISFEEFSKAMMEDVDKGNDTLGTFANVGGNYNEQELHDDQEKI